jgi:hypothetical protein
LYSEADFLGIWNPSLPIGLHHIETYWVTLGFTV